VVVEAVVVEAVVAVVVNAKYAHSQRIQVQYRKTTIPATLHRYSLIQTARR